MKSGEESGEIAPATPSIGQKLQLPASCVPPSDEHPNKQKVWVIFGATGQIGRSLVQAALAHNDQVTAVGRRFHDSIDRMRATQSPPSSLDQKVGDKEASPIYLATLCDVRIRETVDAVLKTSLDHWGKIDIIANCSGYGIIGACEDQDDFEIRDQFETNFWGTLHILQLSLPYFREREAGRYIILSSVSGALGVPGLGPYCATKYAVEGLIESMLYETAVFNIRATLVEPGYVRSDVGQGSEPKASKKGSNLSAFGHFLIKPASEPYDNPTAPAGHAKRTIQWLGGKQTTSAAKSAELVWQLGHCHYPPLRLLLGGFAVDSVRERLRGVTEEIEDWKSLRFKQDDDAREEVYDDGDEDRIGIHMRDGEEGEDDVDDEDDEDAEEPDGDRDVMMADRGDDAG